MPILKQRPRRRMSLLDQSLVILKDTYLWYTRPSMDWKQVDCDGTKDVLSDMGFFPCKAETDIWMRRDCRDHYKYITVYCDDLTIASRDPKAITEPLFHDRKIKLKGTQLPPWLWLRTWCWQCIMHGPEEVHREDEGKISQTLQGETQEISITTQAVSLSYLLLKLHHHHQSEPTNRFYDRISLASN